MKLRRSGPAPNRFEDRPDNFLVILMSVLLHEIDQPFFSEHFAIDILGLRDSVCIAHEKIPGLDRKAALVISRKRECANNGAVDVEWDHVSIAKQQR